MPKLSAVSRIPGSPILMAGWLFACSGENPSTGAASAPVGGNVAPSSVAIGGNVNTTSTIVGGSSTRFGGAVGTTTATSAALGGSGVPRSVGGGSPTMGGASAQTLTNSTGGTSLGGSDKGTYGGAGGQSRNGGGTATGATGGMSATSNTSRGGTPSGGSATGGTASGGNARGGTAGGRSAIGGAPTSTSTSGGASAGATGASTTATSELCPGAAKTISVATNGGGDFSTIQAAVNSIASNNAKPIQISLHPGTYNEKVTINRPFVCLTGEAATSTIISNTSGTNIVNGGTVIVTGSDFSAANITFQNSAALGSAQAVALMAQGQRQQFRNCRFVSYQDTLYVNTGTQYFKDCYIQGNTDFIFGDATAVFENCTLNSVAEGTAVTAPRTPQNTTYGFVFLGGAVTANATTSTVRANHVHLGRPWGPYAAAAFIRVDMGVHVATAGWTTMSNNDLSNTRFWEYKSTGAGANTTNASRAIRQLSDAQAADYNVKNVLNPWVPAYSSQ